MTLKKMEKELRDAGGRLMPGHKPKNGFKPGHIPKNGCKPGEHRGRATEFKPGNIYAFKPGHIQKNGCKPGEHLNRATEFKPGNIYAFKPGDPNNPRGRRKLSPEERNTLEKIRGLAPLVAEQMEQFLRDEETPLILRIKIFEIILDRTYGKAPAKVDITSSQDAVEAAQARLDAIFARGLMTGDEPEKEATPAIVVDQERDGAEAIVVISEAAEEEKEGPDP